jgi:hypothetical protein
MDNQMMDATQFTAAIEAVGSSDLQWKMLPLEKLQDLVDIAIEMDEEQLGQVITTLSDQAFAGWTKKLWTEQDMMPTDEYDAYERSKPIMIALKRSLLHRIPVENLASKRASLQQQLALISLILNPTMIARKTGLPLNAVGDRLS